MNVLSVIVRMASICRQQSAVTVAAASILTQLHVRHVLRLLKAVWDVLWMMVWQYVRSAQKGIGSQRLFVVAGRLSLTGMGGALAFSQCARVIARHASKATKGWCVSSVMRGTGSLALSAVILPSATSLLPTDVPAVQLPKLTAFDANTVTNRQTVYNVMRLNSWWMALAWVAQRQFLVACRMGAWTLGRFNVWFARQASLWPKIPYTAVLPCTLPMGQFVLCVLMPYLVVFIVNLGMNVLFVLRDLLMLEVHVVIQI